MDQLWWHIPIISASEARSRRITVQSQPGLCREFKVSLSEFIAKSCLSFFFLMACLCGPAVESLLRIPQLGAGSCSQARQPSLLVKLQGRERSWLWKQYGWHLKLSSAPPTHTFSPASCYAIPALQRWCRKIKAILGRYFFLMENLL